MSPRAVVETSIEEQLDIIAICDHNAMENVQFVLRSVEGKPLTLLPRMEITSSEEVHLLALFDTLDDLTKIQNIVYDHLPGTNREEIFGCQTIVNELDEVEGFNDRFLLGATQLSLLEIIHHIHGFGGLAIASHIDRESFSIIGQLGFIDQDIPLDALEITYRTGIKRCPVKISRIIPFPICRIIGCAFYQGYRARGDDDVSRKRNDFRVEDGL